MPMNEDPPPTAAIIDQFRESWEFTRGLTHAFIDATPDER